MNRSNRAMCWFNEDTLQHISDKDNYFSSFFAAPNVYSIPTVLGSSKEGQIKSAPAYSITGKIKAKLPKTVLNPGEIGDFRNIFNKLNFSFC